MFWYDSESAGRGFESPVAHQKKKGSGDMLDPFFFVRAIYPKPKGPVKKILTFPASLSKSPERKTRCPGGKRANAEAGVLSSNIRFDDMLSTVGMKSHGREFRETFTTRGRWSV
jgi:hypothetical protein